MAQFSGHISWSPQTLSFILIPKEASGYGHVPHVFDIYLHVSLKMPQWHLLYRDSDSMAPYKDTFQQIAFFICTLKKFLFPRENKVGFAINALVLFVSIFQNFGS